MNIIQELKYPTVTYNDKGEMETRPPTALMLRAARTLEQIANVDQTNQILIQQLQHDNNELRRELQELQHLRDIRKGESSVENRSEESGGSN